MALGSADERDLLLPLFEGIHETPAWRTFLRRLMARTGADRLGLMLRPAAQAGPSIQWISADPDALPLPDLEILSTLGLIPYAALRPHRVYALEEFFNLDSTEARERQQTALDAADITYGRFIRVAARGDSTGWLILLHARADFSAADSALLSSLAAPFGAALATRAELDAAHLRMSMAEDTLGLLGIGQIALDRDGRVLAATAQATATLDAQPGGRLPLPARAGQALAEACAALAGASAGERRVVRIDERLPRDLLLRPAPEPAAAVAVIRTARREDEASAAQVIARAYGLSAREAALAEAISHGRPLVEAGAALGLTTETTRNYSKRIYAKTGTTGQADLVRLLLTGLAPLA